MACSLPRLLLPVACLAGILLFGSANAAERPSFALNQQAVEQMQQGNYLGAIELLQKALVIQPQHDVVLYNLGQAHLRAGEQLINEKRYTEAVEILQEGKQYDDQESRLWLFRGLALLKTNDYLFAESELNEAWAISGDEPQVLWLLGRLYYDTDRVHDAVDSWERALQLEPGNPMIEGYLSRARRELAVEAEMEKGYGSHFVISYDGKMPVSLSNDILNVLEDAYDWVGSHLGHYPQRQVPVLVYTSKDFKSLTNSPGWASGLYDGKIRLPAGGISGVDAEVRGLLFHEYMHVVVREMAGDGAPFWLNEGLAEVAAREQHPLALEQLKQFYVGVPLFDWSELEAPTNELEESRVAVAYLQSYAFARFLLDEYGWFQIQDLLTALGRGASLSEAVDQSFGVFAVDYGTLQKRWAESLQD